MAQAPKIERGGQTWIQQEGAAAAYPLHLPVWHLPLVEQQALRAVSQRGCLLWLLPAALPDRQYFFERRK